MFLLSNRMKTPAVYVLLLLLLLFFSCFVISNANDPQSLRLRELLRNRQEDSEEENSLEELRNFRKSNENNEIDIDAPITCSPDQFLCNSSSDVRCIYDDWVCDGDRDCEEGEDELNCSEFKDCPDDGMFRCLSVGRRCVPLQWVCDGERDCPDESDELLCPSSSSSTRRPQRADCPPQFNYVAEFSQCYSPLVDGVLDQREAGAVCRQFHPRAHLPVVMNNDQNLFIRHLILKEKPELCPLGVWTSGRRSHSFRPFTWHLPSSSTPPPKTPPEEEDEEREDTLGRGGGERISSGKEEGEEKEEQRPLNYTNWVGQKPRIGFGRRENCLFIDRTNDFKWNQRRCEDLLCVICQLDLLP